jgi:hypothetical protein
MLGIGVPAGAVVRLSVSVVVIPSYDAVDVLGARAAGALAPHPASTIAEEANATIPCNIRGLENFLLLSLMAPRTCDR